MYMSKYMDELIKRKRKQNTCIGKIATDLRHCRERILKEPHGTLWRKMKTLRNLHTLCLFHETIVYKTWTFMRKTSCHHKEVCAATSTKEMM